MGRLLLLAGVLLCFSTNAFAEKLGVFMPEKTARTKVEFAELVRSGKVLYDRDPYLRLLGTSAQREFTSAEEAADYILSDDVMLIDCEDRLLAGGIYGTSSRSTAATHVRACKRGEKLLYSQSNKIAFASTRCGNPIVTPKVVEACVPETVYAPSFGVTSGRSTVTAISPWGTFVDPGESGIVGFPAVNYTVPCPTAEE